MADLKENEMMKNNSPAWLRSLNASGNSCITPVDFFLKKVDFKCYNSYLSHNLMISFGTFGIWERFTVLFGVGSSDGNENAIVLLTGTYQGRAVVVTGVNKIGVIPGEVKLLYKIENDKIHLSIHSSIIIGSVNPFICFSSGEINVSVENDISGYTSIAIP